MWTKSGYVFANEESLGSIPDACPMERLVAVCGDEALAAAYGIIEAVVTLCGAGTLAARTRFSDIDVGLVLEHIL